MTTFVDTSALYALIDEDDANHHRAADTLRALRGADLVTHAYIVVETLALVGRRLPWPATTRLIDVVLPVIDVRSVDDALHRAASVAYREAGTAGVSFVDRTSFAFMRAQGVNQAFGFDDDFPKHGFELVSAA